MSSGDHPDVATYKRTADAFRARDMKAIANGIHEDVVWHFPGTSILAAEVRGRVQLIEYLQTALERTSGTFLLEDRSISGNDDHVVAFQRWGATFGAETKLFDVISVMRFQDGRQRERWFHPVDLAAFDAFWSPAT